MTAVVTLKITPNELQTINEALRMFAWVVANRLEHDNPLYDYRIDLSASDNDPRAAAMMAQKIRHDIGLR